MNANRCWPRRGPIRLGISCPVENRAGQLDPVAGQMEKIRFKSFMVNRAI